MPDFDPTFMIKLLYAVAALLWIAALVKKLFFPSKLPSPLTVRGEIEFVPKHEHEAHRKEVHEKLTTAAINRKGIYSEVEALKTRTARLEEKDAAIAEKVDLLSSDFRAARKETNELLNTIIAKLK